MVIGRKLYWRFAAPAGAELNIALAATSLNQFFVVGFQSGFWLAERQRQIMHDTGVLALKSYLKLHADFKDIKLYKLKPQEPHPSNAIAV
jgi:hypothetical protein